MVQIGASVHWFAIVQRACQAAVEFEGQLLKLQFEPTVFGLRVSVCIGAIT